MSKKPRSRTPLMLRLECNLVTLKEIKADRGGDCMIKLGGKYLSCAQQIKRIKTAIKKEAALKEPPQTQIELEPKPNG